MQRAKAIPKGDGEEDERDDGVNSPSVPKIRRISSRKSVTTERYKQMLYDDESDGFNDEFNDKPAEYDDSETGAKKRKMSAGSDATAGGAKPERNKKTIHACPHSDKPYYAKGKCRPCYWADWRRNDGYKKGKLLLDPCAEGTSTATVSPGNKKKRKSYEASDQKKSVALDDVQCIAFRLNKATDSKVVHDLLIELRSYYVTAEIIKNSHLLLVVKRLTQNASTTVSDLAKTLFDEFVETLNTRDKKQSSSPVEGDGTNGHGLNGFDGENSNHQDESQDGNHEINSNGSFSKSPRVKSKSHPQPSSLPNQNFSGLISLPQFSTSLQNNINYSQPHLQQVKSEHPQKPKPQKSHKPHKSRASKSNSTPTNVSPAPLSYNSLPMHHYNGTSSASSLSLAPVSPPQANNLMGQYPVTSPSTTPLNYNNLVNEIAMMNSAIAHLTNMNNAMLNNLANLRYKNSMNAATITPTQPIGVNYLNNNINLANLSTMNNLSTINLNPNLMNPNVGGMLNTSVMNNLNGLPMNMPTTMNPSYNLNSATNNFAMANAMYSSSPYALPTYPSYNYPYIPNTMNASYTTSTTATTTTTTTISTEQESTISVESMLQDTDEINGENPATQECTDNNPSPRNHNQFSSLDPGHLSSSSDTNSSHNKDERANVFNDSDAILQYLT